MFYLNLQEYNNDWEGDSPLSSILELMENSPFGSFQEMDLNNKFAWQPYDQKIALQSLKKVKKSSVNFRKPQDLSFLAGIYRNADPLQNSVTFGVSEQIFSSIPIVTLIEYTKQLATLFPEFGRAYINGFEGLGDLYNKHQLRDLPVHVGMFVTYYLLISPSVYSDSFKRTDLLEAPYYKITELENGWLEMIAYPDPLSYNTPETQEQILEITRYLNNCRFDKF